MSHLAVLCIGAGALQVPLLQEARALGLYVIATDGNPEAPGKRVADVFAPIDTYDIQGTCHFALTNCTQAADFRLLGVVTAGADIAPTVAAVAQAVGLPGIPVAVAHRSHDKAQVRNAVEASGLQVYQPAWREYATVLDFIESDTVPAFPFIAKPLQERASRGVTICDNYQDIAPALAKVHQYGPAFLVEQYLFGTEHSVEGILVDQELAWFNVVDRDFQYDTGVPLELGHVNPSFLSPLRTQQLKLMLHLVAGALGVTWGPFKMDVLWTDDGPKLLEATCRLSGGWDCQGTSPLTGRRPLRTLLQVACALPRDPIPEPHGYAACAAILPTKEGVLQQIPWHAEAPDLNLGARISKVIWNVKVGDHIQTPAHCAQRAGFVLAHADTYGAAWQAATYMARKFADAMEIV